ncbi:MAG: hypothetical protein D6805_07575 [Planctomycetota bacterium]|nr:MAG: hypothetical protein D6805_07575 [Planctomycetota bacterium]
MGKQASWFWLVWVFGSVFTSGALANSLVDVFEVKGPPKVVVFEPHRRELSWLPVKVHRLVFVSSTKTPVANNNLVPCLYFQPIWKRSDAGVILLSWWKSKTTKKIAQIGTMLASSGINVLFVPLAYQYERSPKGVGSGNWTVSGNLPRTQQALIQSVKDIRLAATWLLSQGIDSKKLGIMGISLGGFLAALSYGVDRRFRAGAIILAGGNYRKMVEFHASRLPEISKLERGNFTQKDIDRMLRLLDPITYADRRRGKGLLIVNGLFDMIVPYSCGRSLYRAYGREADFVSLPCGHYTAVAFLPYILGKVIWHFRKHFRD